VDPYKSLCPKRKRFWSFGAVRVSRQTFSGPLFPNKSRT
jgi:hypothetical protein